jgi:hypothetical protein
MTATPICEPIQLYNAATLANFLEMIVTTGPSLPQRPPERFISTNPDASWCHTGRSAVILAIIPAARQPRVRYQPPEIPEESGFAAVCISRLRCEPAYGNCIAARMTGLG